MATFTGTVTEICATKSGVTSQGNSYSRTPFIVRDNSNNEIMFDKDTEVLRQLALRVGDFVNVNYHIQLVRLSDGRKFNNVRTGNIQKLQAIQMQMYQ